MYSFIPDDDSVRALLFIGTFYLCVIFAFWRTNILRIDQPHRSQYLLIFLVIFHLVFAFEGGDYFHYYEGVTKNMLTDGQEPFYHWLSRIVCNDYILWRLIIWGSALILFMRTAMRFGLDQYKVVYLLYVMYFTLFDYARASLGMAVYFFGLSFWCKPMISNKMLSYFVIAPSIMLVSIFFHSSMFLTCAASVFAFLPINRKILLVALLFLGSSSTLLHTAFNSLVGTIISSSSGFVAGKVEEYSLQQAEFGGSKYEELRRYVEYATFFLPMLYLTYQVLRKKVVNTLQREMLRLYKVTMAIILLSVYMLTVSTSIILFNRILYLSMLGIVLLLFNFRREHIISKSFFYFVILLSLFQVFFNFSKRILGGNIPW